MIDIHSHILHSLDDGAKSFEQSLEMVKAAAAADTTDIVATPHANLHYKFQPELVNERIAELQAAVGANPRIHFGCDFHLAFDNIQDAVAHPEKYSINHKRYLLVEFSDLTIFPTTTAIFDQLLGAGLIPVITHPERNLLLQMRLEQLRGWVDMGCLIQVTGQSFLGRFGNKAKQFSDVLMKNGIVHFVASDAHDALHRPPALTEAREYIAEKYGEAIANRVLVDNPKRALTGEPLQEVAAAPADPKKWYQFWG